MATYANFQGKWIFWERHAERSKHVESSPWIQVVYGLGGISNIRFFVYNVGLHDFFSSSQVSQRGGLAPLGDSGSPYPQAPPNMQTFLHQRTTPNPSSNQWTLPAKYTNHIFTAELYWYCSRMLTGNYHNKIKSLCTWW